MANKPEWRNEDTEHPTSVLLSKMMEEHREICGLLRISPWDYCCVLANVQALICAESQDMPRDAAMNRFAELRKLIGNRFDAERAERAAITDKA